MKIQKAVKSLSAIAHSGRLELIRLLIQAGEGGIGAGELAERAGIRPSTASAQLNMLSNAELIYSKREGRHITYFADYQSLGNLIAFLLHDCCGNRQEVCCALNGTS